MATSSKKRPCRQCRRWFRPDPRVGPRQHTCRAPQCQRRRRAANARAWRESHPDYFRARRLLARRADPVRPPPRYVAPLDRVPWDLAQNQFGTEGAEFIGDFGRVLVTYVQNQMPP